VFLQGDIGQGCPCSSGHDADRSSCLATLSHAVAWKKISVPISLLQQIGREMNSRVCTWNRSQLGNDLLESVFFRKHVEKIGPFANHMLNPLWVQEVLESDPIHMAVGFHLEDEIVYVAKAKAAVPP